MLTYLLAWAMAVASLGLYLTAFFFPELHRKNDLVLSGVGLFFALTLWIYAERLRGGLLLGETAAVVLILWFGWQSIQYRWQETDPKLKTDATPALSRWQSIQQAVQSVLSGKQAPGEEGIPSNKITGQIAEWVSKVDIEALKDQFQSVIQKVPLPNAAARPTPTAPESPTDTSAPGPGPAEFVSEIEETVIEETVAVVEVEAADQSWAAPDTIEPEPSPVEAESPGPELTEPPQNLTPSEPGPFTEPAPSETTAETPGQTMATEEPPTISDAVERTSEPASVPVTSFFNPIRPQTPETTPEPAPDITPGPETPIETTAETIDAPNVSPEAVTQEDQPNPEPSPEISYEPQPEPIESETQVEPEAEMTLESSAPESDSPAEEHHPEPKWPPEGTEL